ncbi:MAG: DUF2147 domain-containing protein [Sphaerochaetaceae bacterium]
MTRRKKLALSICALILIVSFPLVGAEVSDIVGFWKSVNSRRNFATSIIGIYEYEGMLYGRPVVGFDEKTGALIDTINTPSQRIERLPGRPLLMHTDIVWGLYRSGDKWVGGKILDPRYGHVFDCEAWVQEETLILRGKLGPFGLNTVFYRATEEDLPKGFTWPSLETFIPNSR